MSRAHRFFTHVKVLLTMLPLTGCFVLVETFDVREQCGIQGSGACATCIRSSCQATVDGCCGSATCAAGSSGTSILDDVDACGRGETSRCASALADQRSGGEEEALRQCIQASCRTACTVPSSTGNGSKEPARWTCDAPRTGTSKCEQCVDRACAAKLDECCADDTCANESDIQSELGTCFAGDPRACAWAFRDASADGTSGIVRRCIVDSCYDACLGDGLPHTDCTPRAGGAYCTCTNAEESSGPECSASKIGVDYCVIGRTGCTCGAFRLASATSSTCTVDYEGGPDTHSDRSCVPYSEGRCCLTLEDDGISCECDTSEYASRCTDSEYSISECSESAIKALLGDLIVPSCSR
jgi:hypothetical protein